uniref:Uncharacterized protein n=1 Tax=Pelusios castaneus TaxID=367368 RepID=A0A8C8RJ88_9SAUR
MALSDLLYPGNPGKREKVTRLQQELIDCMELTFEATNELIEILNTHLLYKLSPIKMNKEGTIQENCDIFTATTKSIQDVLQDIDKKLSRKLEPDLYRKLHDLHETDHVKMRIVRAAFSLGAGSAGILVSGFIIKLAISKVATSALSQIATIMAKIGASVAGAVIGAAVGLGLDLIISAVTGAIERDKLEAAIQELEPLVKEFKSASRMYYKTIISTTDFRKAVAKQSIARVS